MTEAEWLACADPERMLDFLGARAGERKMKLLACACCRRVWHLLLFEPSRRSVEVAERFADGLEEAGVLGDAGSDAYDTELGIGAVASPPSPYDVEEDVLEEVGETIRAAGFNGRAVFEAAKAAAAVCDSPVIRWALPAVLRSSAAAASWAGRPKTGTPDPEAARAERSAQSALVREVFGHLVFPARVGTSALTRAVASLARAAYDQRDLPSGVLDPTRLAVLADALEEAGCDDEEVLTHLRGPGPHVRGCWPVDLVLGKT